MSFAIQAHLISQFEAQMVAWHTRRPSGSEYTIAVCCTLEDVVCYAQGPHMLGCFPEINCVAIQMALA